MPLAGADMSVNLINVPVAYGSGGRVDLSKSTSSPLLVWDSLDGAHYEVFYCAVSGAATASPSCAGVPVNLTAGNHLPLFGYMTPSNVGAPFFFPDGAHIGMSVANPVFVSACTAAGLATTPGQGCGNDIWVCNFSTSLGLTGCANWTNNPSNQYVLTAANGVLYGVASNASPGYVAIAYRFGPVGVVSGTYSSGITTTGVGHCNLAFIGGATATVNVSGGVVASTLVITDPSSGYTSPPTTASVSAGGGGVTCTGPASVSTFLGGGDNTNGSVGAFGYWGILLYPYTCTASPCASGSITQGSVFGGGFQTPNISTSCISGSACWYYEMSGFFGGTTNATNYLNNTDNGLLIVTANLRNQPMWRADAYAWNFAANTVDEITNWGYAPYPLCSWNEHFHPTSTQNKFMWASSSTRWSGSCGASYPSTIPPLDLYETPLWYYKDASGNERATSLLEETGQATEITYFNVSGTPENNQLCAIPATMCSGGGVFSGGDGTYGPLDSYYVLSNAPSSSSAVLALSRYLFSTRINGAMTVSGNLGISH
jgi:hypothetical protein